MVRLIKLAIGSKQNRVKKNIYKGVVAMEQVELLRSNHFKFLSYFQIEEYLKRIFFPSTGRFASDQHRQEFVTFLEQHPHTFLQVIKRKNLPEVLIEHLLESSEKLQELIND